MAHLDPFESIVSFTEFSHLGRDEHYHRVPDDWYVIVADIVDSTNAIESGRYRDVNTLGAACIATAQNAIELFDFPYVFGGDGASIVLPAEHTQKAFAALLSLQSMATEHYEMRLRIGAVKVEEIRKQGADIQVARFELAAGRSIAMFRGGGLAMADRLVKADPQKYALEVYSTPCSLSGLSCRWDKIPSRRGNLMSILISGNDAQQPYDYEALLGRIRDILGDEIESANPIDIESMRYRKVGDNLSNEARMHKRKWSLSYIRRAIEIVCCDLFFNRKWPAIGVDARHYERSTPKHADYRKFDDMLRMVLDCSIEQADAIDQLLGREHEAGRVCFGTHRSAHALMTCLVEHPSDGKHIHFVDGDSGGYAAAARQLKQQLKLIG